MSGDDLYYLGIDGSNPSTQLVTGRHGLAAFAARILLAVELGLRKSARSELRRILDAEASNLWGFVLLMACWRVQQTPVWPHYEKPVDTLTRHFSSRLRPYYRGLDQLSDLISPFLEATYYARNLQDLAQAGKDLTRLLLLMGRGAVVLLAVLFDSDQYRVLSAQLARVFMGEEEDHPAKFLTSRGWSQDEVQRLLR